MPEWDVSLVTDMQGLFRDCPGGEDWCGNVVVTTSAFNQPIGSWNTARVTSMRTMFMYAAAFNQPIGSWNTSQVKNTAHMFRDATSFNQAIGAWDTSQVTDMQVHVRIAPPSFNEPSAPGIPRRCRACRTCSEALPRSTKISATGIPRR
jgi:surface protein